nr:hypothetical protein KPHV_46990 [Kitasatospora purpeofusca]
MKPSRKARRAAPAALQILAGAQAGGTAVYLLDHHTRTGGPVYLALFAAGAFAALFTADRLLNHRGPPPDRGTAEASHRRSG